MKTFIQNRKNQKVSVLVEERPDTKGVVFVMHGLGSYKELAHLETYSSAFLESDYTVVRFDATNSFGESDGKFEDATLTNYCEDLEDVIDWSKDQSWYQEPFVLVGHSLGSICVLLYTEKYPEQVKALAPTSTVINWELSRQTKVEFLEKWKQDGVRVWFSRGLGKEKRLKWNHIEDRMKYNVLDDVDKITMPTLLLVGSEDVTTPLAHHQVLFDELKCPKELHVIKGAKHDFTDKSHLQEIKNIFKVWIDSLK